MDCIMGNLIKDKSEEIAQIKWTASGKVSDVIRTAGSQKPDLHFDYDAMGQRIAKTVTNKNVTTGDKFVTTYYVRDPQGNVLAVYEHKHGDSDNGTFTLAEQHLYGAGRLGMRKRDLALNATNANESPATYYELTNHLGNVMAVISDKASSTNEPAVVSLSDYYPYGMTEPGRSWNSGDYRFGYTGHEKENDLAEGVYTTEYRLLDTRLGRWLSVDPLFGKYPGMSSYNYCGGNPMVFCDSDGRDLNGNNVFANYSSQSIFLGGCTGSNKDGKEVLYEKTLFELKPHHKLVPFETKDGEKLAHIYRMEMINDRMVDVYVETIYAYDVDYIKLQQGQTLTTEDGTRYSTDINDDKAVTPISTWTKNANENNEIPDHTLHGDLKIAPSSDYFANQRVINFQDNGEDEIKCNIGAPTIGIIKKFSFFEPSIFSEFDPLPHVKTEKESSK